MGNDLVDLVWAEFSPFKGDYRVQLIITLRRPSDTRRNTRKCHEHISWPDDCFWWLIGGYFQLCLHITDHFLTQSQKACRLLFSNRELLHVTRCVNHDIWSPTCFIEINIWRFCWRLLFKDGKRVLFWRSDCCLCFRPTTLGLRGPCTACCLGRTCRWPTKEACGRQTACLEGECSKEAPICLYLTSFLVHMCADGNPPPHPPENLTATCGWTCFTRCWTFQTPARCQACGASAAGWTPFCRRTMATNYPRLRAGWWCCCWRTARRCGDNGCASLWKKAAFYPPFTLV